MSRASGHGATLQQALALHRAGRLAEAKAAYEATLAELPGQPDALHLLGTLLCQQGRPAEAVPLLEQAVRRLPASASCQAHLAEALAAVGRGNEAEAGWRRAVKLDPRSVEANFHLAGHLASALRWTEAEPFARRAAGLLPASAPTRFRLGLVLEGLGRPSDALVEFRAAAGIAPLEVDIWRRVRAAAMASGHAAAARLAVQRLGVLSPALTETVVAIEALARSSPAAWDRGRWSRRGAAAAPADGFLRAVSASRRVDSGDYDGALAEARRALIVAPDAPLAHTALARAANILARFELAGAAARRGLCSAPLDAELIYQRAQVEKATGDLAAAWDLDEHRIRGPRFHRTANLPPRWGGPGHPAGRLLVATEQGIGDELLFMSCLPELLCDVPDPVVELDARLHPLFRRSFPGITLLARQAFRGAGDRAVFDYRAACRDHGITHHIHAGSLFALYRRDRSRPSTRRSYLQADPDARESWRRRLAGLGDAPKVGVCWRSVVHSAIRSTYYAPLADWAPLLRQPGIRFVCLQYDDCRAELDALRAETGIDLWVPEGLDQMDDLDGAAALMAALDAVVSAPTTVCMMAAALGVETYRVGHSTYSIGHDHDHFFPSMHPLVPSGGPLDLQAAIHRAAGTVPAALREASGARFA